MTTGLKLIAQGDRLETLDVIRGFALCGIIFANLMSFTGFYSLSFTQIQSLPLLDRLVLFLIDVFIEGKFYTVFAILFGAGFTILQQRRLAQEKPFARYWCKRMSVLLLIGVIHMMFIWHGDILILYSLLGFFLLFFTKLSNKQLLGYIALLLSAPLFIHLLAYFTFDNNFWGMLRDVANNFKSGSGYEHLSLLEMRTSSEPFEVFIANLYSAIPRPMSYLITGRPFQVLGQFLIGILFVRIFLNKTNPASLPSKRTTILLLLFGTFLNIQYGIIKALIGSPFLLNELGLYQGVVYHLGAIVMAFGYIALLSQLSLYPLLNSLKKLAVLGRMSLTVYLTQTSVSVFIFYGYGFGLMGKVPFATIFLFGVGILLTQYLIAHWWFTFQKQGPIEMLWRKYI